MIKVIIWTSLLYLLNSCINYDQIPLIENSEADLYSGKLVYKYDGFYSGYERYRYFSVIEVLPYDKQNLLIISNKKNEIKLDKYNILLDTITNSLDFKLPFDQEFKTNFILKDGLYIFSTKYVESQELICCVKIDLTSFKINSKKLIQANINKDNYSDEEILELINDDIKIDSEKYTIDNTLFITKYNEKKNNNSFLIDHSSYQPNNEPLSLRITPLLNSDEILISTNVISGNGLNDEMILTTLDKDLNGTTKRYKFHFEEEEDQNYSHVILDELIKTNGELYYFASLESDDKQFVALHELSNDSLLTSSLEITQLIKKYEVDDYELGDINIIDKPDQIIAFITIVNSRKWDERDFLGIAKIEYDKKNKNLANFKFVDILNNQKFKEYEEEYNLNVTYLSKVFDINNNYILVFEDIMKTEYEGRIGMDGKTRTTQFPGIHLSEIYTISLTGQLEINWVNILSNKDHKSTKVYDYRTRNDGLFYDIPSDVRANISEDKKSISIKQKFRMQVEYEEEALYEFLINKENGELLSKNRLYTIAAGYYGNRIRPQTNVRPNAPLKSEDDSFLNLIDENIQPRLYRFQKK